MAGSKITDQPNQDGVKQEQAYSFPYITPSGHEISFYDTAENQRVVIKHTSGSALEFKADGSVILKTVKDFHVHSSVLSSQTTINEGSDQCLQRYDTDLDLVVGGKLNIKCAELNIEVGSAAKCKAGTDFVISGNNIIEKATESISLEAAKSLYIDTKEYKERVQTHTTNMGNHGDTGGVGIMNVSGNFVLRNNDPDGGITIASAGYTNIITGQERCDITGRYHSTPGSVEGEQRATWTQKVYNPTTPSSLRLGGNGDYWFESESSVQQFYATDLLSPTAGGNGHLQEVALGNEFLSVSSGNRIRSVALNETVNIGGVQRTQASKIFLN